MMSCSCLIAGGMPESAPLGGSGDLESSSSLSVRDGLCLRSRLLLRHFSYLSGSLCECSGGFCKSVTVIVEGVELLFRLDVRSNGAEDGCARNQKICDNVNVHTCRDNRQLYGEDSTHGTAVEE